ncbi:MAG: helicase, partial [Caulobacteraceae bacterium]
AILRSAARNDPAGLFLPPSGAQSAPVDPGRSWASYAAAGYRPAGPRAARLDALERLAGACAAARGAGRDFPLVPAIAQTIAAPVRDIEGVLTALGYKRVQEGDAGAPSRWRPPQPGRSTRASRPKPADANAFGALAGLIAERKAGGS